MERNLLIAKRKFARKLYFKKRYTITKISEVLCSKRDSVRTWIQLSDNEISKDGRGWKKGKLRRYKEGTRERVVKIRKQLKKEQAFFFGSKVIRKNYQKEYPDGEQITEYFTNKTIKEEKDKTRKIDAKKLKKGEKARYMNYPQDRLDKLGKVVEQIDFIGPKYVKGSKDRINFLSRKYIRPIKLGLINQIKGQTTEETIRILIEDWKKHPKPEVIRIDNDSAFGSVKKGEGYIGGFTKFLLNLNITPVYTAPRSPWNNGAVEGHNNVFTKKFWNEICFENKDDIKIELKRFNLEYEAYSKLIRQEPEENKHKHIEQSFTIKKGLELTKKILPNASDEIYYLRVVRRTEDSSKGSGSEEGFVNIMGKVILIGKSYINSYILAKVNIKGQKLTIYSQNENGNSEVISAHKFAVNL